MERRGEDNPTNGTTLVEPRLVDGMYVSPDGIPSTLWWDHQIGPKSVPAGVLRLVDQTRLPGEYLVRDCADLASVAHAIRTLQVRGAPAIGVAAAYGLALGAREELAPQPRSQHGDGEPDAPSQRAARSREQSALAHLETLGMQLRGTRPTAVNLAWAVARLMAVAQAHLATDGAVADLPERLLLEAHAVAAEDVAACRAMGRYGATLIEDGAVLLTHCNAGALATAGMGTALAPIFVAHKAGKRLHVYVDETRPLLQGARLTTWELARAGVPLTLITDNMAAHFMRRGGIGGIFVGADRIAANGDVANKIGTYGLAVLAQAHGIPLYVVAPRSTIDRALPDGEAIPIEQRGGDEVTAVRGVALAPAGVAAANPAFDVTPARYVAAIVTEAGIARPPYAASLAAQFREA